MEFNPNKTPVEIIKAGGFDGTYFRDIYSIVKRKWYKSSWKDFNELKTIDPKHYSSNYYDVKLNKYKVKNRTSSEFWENKGSIDEIHPYGWFKWYFRYFLRKRSS